jgi:hypothetical protein
MLLEVLQCSCATLWNLLECRREERELVTLQEITAEQSSKLFGSMWCLLSMACGCKCDLLMMVLQLCLRRYTIDSTVVVCKWRPCMLPDHTSSLIS